STATRARHGLAGAIRTILLQQLPPWPDAARPAHWSLGPGVRLCNDHKPMTQRRSGAMAEVISSAANPLIKRVRLLADRKHRRREGAFVVQGIQPVWQAVEAGADIETLVAAPDLLRPAAAAAMVAEQEQQGTRVARLAADLFTRIA